MGGNAFDKTIPIDKELIPKVIKSLTTRMHLGELNYKTLGSTGKKEVSGDIDLALSDKEWDYMGLAHNVLDAVGRDNIKLNPPLKQIYTRVPIPNTKGRKFCQVDLMLGDPELLSFTHWSPYPGTSKYSGSHRTEYIKAVAKALSNVAYRNGKIVARVGYTLFHDKGLEFSARWCPPRKDGQGYTVTMEKVKPEFLDQFREEFKELNYQGEALITDPTLICRELFGRDYFPNMVNSYEQVAHAIKSNLALLSMADLIWELYVTRLDELGLPHPRRYV